MGAEESPGDWSQDAHCADPGIVMHRAKAELWMEMMQIDTVAEEAWKSTEAKAIDPRGAIIAPPARLCSTDPLNADFS
jgi:hypothetical protein